MTDELDDVLTSREVMAFTADIQRQLRELGHGGVTRSGGTMRSAGPTTPEVPERQQQEVERVTGLPFPQFFSRFLSVARNDLCEPGGMLHERWKRVKEMTNEEHIKSMALVLSALGFINWKALVVPVVVIVSHLGVETICRETART